MLKKFLKFALFGLFSALIYFGIYLYLVNIITPLASTFIAFIVSVIVSFMLNSSFVFTNKGSFNIFMLIAISGLFLNMLIVFIFTEMFIKNPILAGIIVVIVIPVHNFLLNYKLNFRE